MRKTLEENEGVAIAEGIKALRRSHAEEPSGLSHALSVHEKVLSSSRNENGWQAVSKGGDPGVIGTLAGEDGRKGSEIQGDPRVRLEALHVAVKEGVLGQGAPEEEPATEDRPRRRLLGHEAPDNVHGRHWPGPKETKGHGPIPRGRHRAEQGCTREPPWVLLEELHRQDPAEGMCDEDWSLSWELHLEPGAQVRDVVVHRH
mmetsp:Transcript_5953/g.17401  ORF Transcript_5953/g.17401 Transcript_5953/m.17401 type:complete len:202 (-) Transcript_5953:319-924(-)